MELKNRSIAQLRPGLCSLQTESAESSPSVIVIGAGIAGLAAARALYDASFQVVVLESRNRIGGRVCTDYTLGFPIDLGASWLHGASNENPLAPLIAKLGLPIYRTSVDNTVLFDHDLESYALFDTDGSRVPPDLVVKVGEIYETILKETGKIRAECEEDMSIHQALKVALSRRPDLRLKGLPHKVLQWYVCRMEGWFATDAGSISLKCWDEEVLLPGGHGLMVRGYLPVINTLAKGLDIRLNHRVTKVARHDSGVRVTVEGGRTLVADAAIVTTPLGVLKAGIIKFEPKLPEWKEEAISKHGVGVENKIVLHFDKVFWPSVEFLGVVADTSYCCSYFLNLHKATGHPVLVYMPAGKLGQDIEKMSDKEAADFTLTQLKQILPDAVSPVQYLVSRWGSDINSLGSYSYDKVGNRHDLYEKLRTPVGSLFFAGEATSVSFPGFIHGAYSTGLQAAEECRTRLSQQYGGLHPSQSVMAEETANVPLLISRL